MAHIDPKTDRAPDRPLVCDAARTWHALAITALVLVAVGPALVIGILLLVEASVPHPNPDLAARTAGGAGRANLRARTHPLLQYSSACPQIERAACPPE
jgi:hypothetical protein